MEYLGCIYYVVSEHFFSAIDHLNYHPSMDVDPNSQSSKSTKCHRFRRRACPSCKIRKYFGLSADEIGYLSKLKVALQS